MFYPTLLFIILLHGTYALYDVTVTVEDPFCILLYDNHTDPVHKTASSQLFLETYFSSGDIRSPTYTYITKTYSYSDTGTAKPLFHAKDNLFPFPTKLTLNSGITEVDLSPHNMFNVTFDINFLITLADGTQYSKCNSSSQVHVVSFEPLTILNASDSTVNMKKTIPFQSTPCLTGDYGWFKCDGTNIGNPFINIKLDFNCHGQCNQLLTTTPIPTTTTWPTTTTTTPKTTMTTEASSQDSDSNNLTICFGVLAGVELILLISGVVYYFRKKLQIFFGRSKNPVGPFSQSAQDPTYHNGPGHRTGVNEVESYAVDTRDLKMVDQSTNEGTFAEPYAIDYQYHEID